MGFVADHTNPPPFVDRTYGEPLFHAGSEIAGLCYAPDDTLWSIEESGVLRHWSREGRLTACHLLTNRDTVWAFNSDATRLASASDQFINIWDAASGRIRKRLPVDSWVMAIDFSLDGKLLASGHDDGMVRLWDVAGGELVAEWQAHSQSLSAIDFHDNRIASAGEDRLIHVWDFAGNKTATLAGHSDRIPALAWQPGGNLLVSAGWDTTARVWHPSNADPLILLNSHADQVSSLAYSRDGRLLAVADSDFTIHVWSDPLQGGVRFVLQDHTEEIRTLAFSRDGSRLATAGADCVVHLWDMNTGRLIAGPNPRARHGIALVEERTIVSTGGTAIQGWEQESALPSWVPLGDSGESVLSIATSPDGKWLAIGGPSAEVKIWDLATRQLKTTLQHTRGPIVNLTFSPNSELLASASVNDGLVWVWRISDAEPILVIPEAADAGTLEALAFHPTKNWLAVGGLDWLATGGSDGALCLWDLDTGNKIASVCTGVTSLAFDSTGRFIAAGTLAQTVVVWEMKYLRFDKQFEFAGHQDRIGSVLFSPNGSWLVSASDDNSLRIWNLRNGRLRGLSPTDCLRRLSRRPRAGRHVQRQSQLDRQDRISDCDEHIDGLGRCRRHVRRRRSRSGLPPRWRRRGRRVVARKFDAAIQSLAFSKDGRYLYTGNGNTTCYRLEMQKLLDD